jgi:hypothetical protein
VDQLVQLRLFLLQLPQDVLGTYIHNHITLHDHLNCMHCTALGDARNKQSGTNTTSKGMCASLHEEVSIYKRTAFSVSRDTVVGIATGYGLDDRGVGVRVLVGST